MKNVECRNRTAERAANATLAIRHLLFVILLGVLCLLIPAKGFGQSSNRWLFVFNTSVAMRDRTKATETITYDLLSTAMHGNIHAGDSIGIWTYDKVLRADEAPLQTWSPEDARAIAQKTMRFLSYHPYENSVAFNDVLTNMLRVIEMSDFITVILISDGNDSFKGTPFDAQINGIYKANYKSQKKAKMPVMTVLRGEKGIITTNTVSLAPWPVDIPLVPVQILAKVVPPKPAPTPPPAPVVPSLIMIGKKAQSTTNVPTDLPDHSGDMPTPVVTEPKPAEIPAPKPEPAPAPKVEEKPIPAPPVVETPQPTAPTEAPGARASASNAPPVQMATPPSQPGVETAASVPSKNLFTARNIAIASVAFTVIVCGLLFMSARNARKAARVRLITRSLDREEK
jgi:hypothetical protein